MLKRLTVLFLCFPLFVQAQNFSTPHYPQHYFRDPLNIPIILAGNYGELRPNHFHSGIDIKTGGHENEHVYAAADGYISRISISNGGFGNAIYITHPNGFTTLYGHLNRFFPALEKYVKQHQYAVQKWDVDFEIPSNEFPVRQGDFIAWSGSTGASLAPHLHFEIRDTKSQKPLNEMLFGFDIKDNIPPAVYRISIYNREKSVYEQTPEIYSVKKINGEYTLSPSLIKVAADKVGFGINTLDHQNGTHNIYGIYEAALYDDDSPDIGFQLDSIGYDESRYINAHIDYKTWKNDGHYFEQLFSLPGNKLNIYHDWNGNGSIDISDGQVHHIRIVVKDAFKNTTTVKFAVQQASNYHPDADTNCLNRMYPDSKDIFENDRVSFYLDEGMLYDQICFQYKEIHSSDPKIYSDIYRLHTALVPLNGFFTLYLKPTKNIPENLRDKMVIVRKGEGQSVAAAGWDDKGWLHASFRNFGDFSMQADDIAPVIKPLGLKNNANLSRAKRISFRIRDNLSGIKSYEGLLDGKWILFQQRHDIIYYIFDEHCPKGNHTLQLTVTDEANNTATYIFHFKR